MYIKIKLLLVFIVACLYGTNVYTQGQNKQTAKDVVDDFNKFLDSGKNIGNTVTPDSQTEAAESLYSGNAYYDSIKFSRQLKQADFEAYHQQRTFSWQYYSGILIFIMVMIIVVLGLILSFKQFQLTEKQVRANLTKPKEETTTIESIDTDIEISKTGLKINTGVIGLAILFLSLAFFFLYLKYVYGISVIDTGN